MAKISKLIDVLDKLLGPQGCPWDKKQTIKSMQDDLLEEAYELVDAINDKDSDKIKEELGDLLHLVVFISKLAEKDSLFSFEDVISGISDKLIRRHPHIFSDTKVNSIKDVKDNWERIKATEKANITRKSLLDRIPKSAPSLLRAQEVIRTINKSAFKEDKASALEEEIGEQLWGLIEKSEAAGIECEVALRNFCLKKESEFRISEQ